MTTAYDAYGRLTGYTRTGDPTQANVYNGLDDRVQVTSGSAVRRYLYDADGRLLGDYGTSATDVKGEYVWLTPMPRTTTSRSAATTATAAGCRWRWRPVRRRAWCCTG